MKIIKEYEMIKNCQCATDIDDGLYSSIHYDAVLAGAGLYLHYIYGEDFRLDFTINGKTYTTDDIKDFHKVLKIIKKDLATLKTNKKVYLVVYTWNLKKEVSTFFDMKDTGMAEYIVDDTIILRDVRNLVSVGSIEEFATSWCKLEENFAPSVLFGKFSDDVAKNFVADHKIFKTAAQMAKAELKAKAPAFVSDWMGKVVPYQEEYDMIRYKCFRASLCFNNTSRIFKDVVSYDQSSAHAHKLVTKIFPCGRPVFTEIEKPMQWYLENKWCWFKASFKNVCPKDGFEYIDPFKVGGHKNIELYMSHIQLETFNMCYEYDDVEFSELITANKAYLPDWIRCAIADMYMEKASYKVKDAHRSSIKVKLNAGSYGIFVERLYDWLDCEEGEEHKKYSNYAWKDAWKSRFMPPQVGVTITDYVFQDEVRIMAANPFMTAYGDTDSIKSTKNDLTMSAITKRNDESHKEIKDFCKKFGYDYELMKDLGEYKPDGEYVLFKAVCPKEYIYMNADGELGATTAGFAPHYSTKNLDTHYHFEKSSIPVILYEPIKKKLDPFRYFSMGSKYTDYKWLWCAEDKVKARVEFTLNIHENAVLEHSMRESYES